MDTYKTKRHAVYLCTYHMIFVTKYRKPVIRDDISGAMADLIRRLAEGLGGELLTAESDRDHIHLLVSLPPDVSPKTAVSSFKTQTSKMVHANSQFMKHVSQWLYGDCPLWSASYFVATAGSVSMETVKQYILNQRSDEHRRKYERTGKYSRKHSSS